MKCESIKPLPTRIKALKPLTKEKFKRGKYLSQIDMILYFKILKKSSYCLVVLDLDFQEVANCLLVLD